MIIYKVNSVDMHKVYGLVNEKAMKVYISIEHAHNFKRTSEFTTAIKAKQAISKS